MQPLRDVTLVFLMEKKDGEITDICLAMKKRGFGVGRWNGAGGKVEKGETIEEGAAREVTEEIGVIMRGMTKVAELTFHFALKSEWDQLVHVFLSESWDGEPEESEEMSPKWFPISDIPYETMWPDDKFWLPLVIRGDAVKATFRFGEGDVILDQHVEVVERF